MKKFTTLFSFFAIALSLTLSSCVDDKESDSVTKIRDGYANQLNALASMYQANGEAELIRAKAEAALNEAEARIKNAEAEGLEIDNELALATLELDIEKLILEAETAKYKALENLYEAELAYQRALSDADAKYLGGLVANYKTEVTALITLQNNLVAAKAAVLSAKYGLEDAQTAKEKDIAGYNATIATQTALKETYEALQTGSKEDARLAAEAAEMKLKTLQETQTNLQVAQTAANNTVSNAITALENTEYYVAAQAFPSAIISGSEIVSKSYTLEGVYNNVSRSFIVIKYVDQTVLAENLSGLKQNVEDAKDILKDAQDALTKAQKDLADTYAAYSADPTDYTKEMAYLQAQTDANTAKQDVVNAESGLGTRERALAQGQQQYNALLTTANVEAYQNAVKAVISAYEGQIDAAIALAINGADLTVQNTLFNQLTAVYNGYTDLETLIAACETAINTAKRAIENYTGVTTQEGVVALREQEVKNLEMEIAAKEIEVKALKALIDAAMQ